MASRGLTDDQILELIHADLPDDFEMDTDEESLSEDNPDALSMLQESDHIPDQTTVEKSITIVLSEENTNVINLDSNACPGISEPADNHPVESLSHDGPRRWKKKPEPVFDNSFRSDSFEVRRTFVQNPVESFMAFFDEELIENVHFQTNLKSVQKGKPASVTRNEILVFLGVNIMMGYHRLNSIASYWNTSDDMGVEPIKKAMPRDRFCTILGNLHVNDNSKMDPTNKDKIFKVRPMIERLNKIFKERRDPKEHLSVDESMIKFKGRSSLKQYNPMKPIKRGYKIWCIADDSGYVYTANLYTGKESNCPKRVKTPLGMGGDVVVTLSEPFKGRNHKLFFDNFFSSIPLLEHLKSVDILACGTIRPNRKDLPALQADRSLKRGDFDYRSTPHGITVYKWMDSKAVTFISNYHGAELDAVTRREKDGSKAVVSCPTVVKDYNRFMGGVDKHDMLRQQYGINRKSTKWWHRNFFGFLDMAIVNSFIVYSESMTDKVSLLDYRRDVARGLMSFSESKCPTFQKRRKVDYTVPSSVPEFTKTKRRCEVCSKKGMEARPFSKCSFCNVHLCVNTTKNCFTEFHSA